MTPPAAVPEGRAVAYLVSRYPALSHAFIETEVAALRELDVDVRTFSVRAARPAELMTDRARAEAAATEVLLGSAGTFVRALTSLLRRSPGALMSGLRTALRSGEPTLRRRLWQVFYLAEAVVLWSRMSRAGLRHVHVHFANNGADVARLAVVLGTAADGGAAGWRWSLAMHGPTEFEDRTRFDLEAKAASASAVACITDFCRSQVMRLLPPETWTKTAVVRMAVDACRFRPGGAERSPAPGSSGSLHVLTVGRLVPEKGAPVLVEAVALARGRGLAVRLSIIGAGPLAAQLAAQAEAAGIAEAVELVGPLGQEQLPDRYRDADVFCLPSFAEGLPVVLMEAMASGLPVVTTAIAGIPELVVDHRTGLVVPPGRADLVADALIELADDVALRRRLGEAGRSAILTHHEPAANARLLLDLWDRTPA
ncbi:MAG: glycosyl transferase [Modestobacter sp.]|nr:glycosyl transferase [Modestobacter sp.]